MATCSNYDCLGFASGKHRRCSQCKKKNILICADCGDMVDNNKKTFCTYCLNIRKIDWAREYQRGRGKENKHERYVKYYLKHRDRILAQNKTKRINRRLLINNHAN